MYNKCCGHNHHSDREEVQFCGHNVKFNFRQVNLCAEDPSKWRCVINHYILV